MRDQSQPTQPTKQQQADGYQSPADGQPWYSGQSITKADADKALSGLRSTGGKGASGDAGKAGRKPTNRKK